MGNKPVWVGAGVATVIGATAVAIGLAHGDSVKIASDGSVTVGPRLPGASATLSGASTATPPPADRTKDQSRSQDARPPILGESEPPPTTPTASAPPTPAGPTTSVTAPSQTVQARLVMDTFELDATKQHYQATARGRGLTPDHDYLLYLARKSEFCEVTTDDQGDFDQPVTLPDADYSAKNQWEFEVVDDQTLLPVATATYNVVAMAAGVLHGLLGAVGILTHPIIGVLGLAPQPSGS